MINEKASITKSKHGYNHIRTFGIVTAENPDSKYVSKNQNHALMKQLKKGLKQSGYVWVEQEGRFNDNIETSLFIFNIDLHALMYYAGKYEQTSFFFGELVNVGDEQKTKSSYYEKKDPDLPYNKKSNPYDLIESTMNILNLSDSKPNEYSTIGGKFKYTFPLKYFGYVEGCINENLQKYFSDRMGDFVDAGINGTGYYSLAVRHRLNEGITENDEEFYYESFEDYSHTLKKSYSQTYECNIYEYVGCRNNCVILEGSFSRLLTRMEDNDFAIISAYRNKFSKKENIERNRELRTILNKRKIGVCQLVGHWIEAPDGKEYDKADKNEITDTVERSYFITGPDEMSYTDFEKLIVELLTIDEATQVCGIIHKKVGEYCLLYPDGRTEKIGDKLSINKISQAYSEYIINEKAGATFVFEGIETPDSISGYRIYEKNMIRYCK